MDLLARKRLRDRKRQVELEKKKAAEAVFKHPDRPYMPNSKKLTIVMFVLLALVIAYVFWTSEAVFEDGCALMAGLECKNIKVSSEGLSFDVHNMLKDKMNITLTLEDCGDPSSQVIKPNEMGTYTFKCELPDKVVRKKIAMTYIGYSGLPHDEWGSIKARNEDGA